MSRILTAAFLVLLIPAAALADFTVVQKVQVKRENEWNPAMNDSSEHVETVFFKSKKVRIDIKDKKDYTVADFEKGIVYTINPETKAYSAIPMSDLEKLREVAFFQIRQKIDQLDKLTPEEKAMAEVMWGPMIKKMRDELANKDKPTKVEIENIEETKEIAGHTCTHAVIKEEGKPVVDVWLTDKLETDVNLSQILSAVALFSPSVKEKTKNLKGFSLKTTYVFRVAGQTNTNASEAVEVKTDEVPAEKFAIPEGFKKEDSALSQAIKQYKEWKKSQEEETSKKEETPPKPEEQKEEPVEEPEKKEQAPEPPKGGEGSK